MGCGAIVLAQASMVLTSFMAKKLGYKSVLRSLTAIMKKHV